MDFKPFFLGLWLSTLSFFRAPRRHKHVYEQERAGDSKVGDLAVCSWPPLKGRTTEDDYVGHDSKTPSFARQKLADRHKHMAVAVQLAYYHSDTYAAVRNFHNGDNLNLGFRELEVQFNMQKEGWRKWFDPENPTATLIPEGLDPNQKENEMADLLTSMRPQARRSLPII